MRQDPSTITNFQALLLLLRRIIISIVLLFFSFGPECFPNEEKPNHPKEERQSPNPNSTCQLPLQTLIVFQTKECKKKQEEKRSISTHFLNPKRSLPEDH
jgi:hypothetical protein